MQFQEYSCEKCKVPTEYSDCICDLLIENGNCRNCMKYKCDCNFTYNFPEGIEQYMMCPITYEVFRDPVVTTDGHTYERWAIEQWIHKNDNPTSPVTGLPLKSNSLVSNRSVRSLIERYRKLVS